MLMTRASAINSRARPARPFLAGRRSGKRSRFLFHRLRQRPAAIRDRRQVRRHYRYKEARQGGPNALPAGKLHRLFAAPRILCCRPLFSTTTRADFNERYGPAVLPREPRGCRLRLSLDLSSIINLHAGSNEKILKINKKMESRDGEKSKQ